MRLAGETAVVTGSTSGIGRAIATRFAAEGARVVVTGRDRGRGEAIVAAITDAAGDALFLPADLADEDACTQLVDEAAARLGSLTILVNNAMSDDGLDGPAGDITTEGWERILRVNLSAALWLARAAIPHMRTAGHGSILNISSRAGERGTPRLAAYSASKGGMNALTRSIAVDYAPDGIRCNTISPGYVLNERRDRELTEDRRQRLEGMHLTRLGEPDDIAHAAVYLASREAEFVTGVNLPVDGGSSAARGLVLG